MTFTSDIDALHAAKSREEQPRHYLGASGLGKECERALWYDFRWCTVEDREGRMVRLLSAGDQFEADLIRDLKECGYRVVEVDPATGDQWACKFANGHGGGHADGVVEDTKSYFVAQEFVLEAKTSNRKSFLGVKRNGMQKEKPQHYAQCQIYMGHLEIHQALYIMMNKDDSELYEEIVPFDQAAFDALMEKADRVVEAKEPPPRNRGHWCLYCNSRNVCEKVEREVNNPAYKDKMDCGEPKKITKAYSTGTAIPTNTCRTCKFSSIQPEGKWRCTKYDTEVDYEKQLASTACPGHLYIKGILPCGHIGSHSSQGELCEPDGVKYSHNGLEFINGEGGYSSLELATLGCLDLLEATDHVREAVGGTVLEVTDEC